MQLITEFSTVKITEVMVSKKIKFLSHQNMMDLEGNASVIALFAKCFVLTYAEVEHSVYAVQCAQKWRQSAGVAILEFLVAPKIFWGG